MCNVRGASFTVKTVVRCIQRNGNRPLIEWQKNGEMVLNKALVDWRRGRLTTIASFINLHTTNGNQRQTSRGCGNLRRRQQRQEIAKREMRRDDETAAVH